MNNDFSTLLINECSTILNWDSTTEVIDWAINNDNENLCLIVIEKYHDYIGWQFVGRMARKGFERATRLMKDKVTDPGNYILYNAAMGGHKKLCRIAKDEWGADDFEWMLIHGAYCGHENICLLAIEWGADKFDLMLVNGARGGHENICKLAKRLGATRFDNMLLAGAKEGHENICLLAKEWACGFTLRDLRQMLHCTKNQKVADLAKKWMKKNK